MIIDLAHVSFLGSAGLGALVFAHEEAERLHVRLSLTGVQANRVVRRVLEVTGLFGLFDIGDTTSCERSS